MVADAREALTVDRHFTQMGVTFWPDAIDQSAGLLKGKTSLTEALLAERTAERERDRERDH